MTENLRESVEQRLRDAASWNQLPEGNVIASKALLTEAADALSHYADLGTAARAVEKKHAEECAEDDCFMGDLIPKLRAALDTVEEKR